jgi:hypothetical protein
MDEEDKIFNEESNKNIEIVFEKIFKMTKVLPDLDTAQLLKEVRLIKNIFDDDEEENVEENNDKLTSENGDTQTPDKIESNIDKNEENKEILDDKIDSTKNKESDANDITIDKINHDSNTNNDNNISKEKIQIDTTDYVSFYNILLEI